MSTWVMWWWTMWWWVMAKKRFVMWRRLFESWCIGRFPRWMKAIRSSNPFSIKKISSIVECFKFQKRSKSKHDGWLRHPKIYMLFSLHYVQ
jgi:hypothetical protein